APRAGDRLPPHRRNLPPSPAERILRLALGNTWNKTTLPSLHVRAIRSATRQGKLLSPWLLWIIRTTATQLKNLSPHYPHSFATCCIEVTTARPCWVGKFQLSCY